MTYNNFNPKQSMPNGNSSAHNPQAGPSVPISLYRELAAELQATKVLLDSQNSQNQQLIQQNQHMRREIEKLVNAALHLQQVADSAVAGGDRQHTYSHPEVRTEASVLASEARSMGKRPRPGAGVGNGTQVQNVFGEMEGDDSAFPEKLVMEVPDLRHRRRSQPEKSPEVNGWWLTIAIALIVITAFGAGYLIMRPLLPKR